MEPKDRAAEVFQRTAPLVRDGGGDSDTFQHTISAQERTRALNPPVDNDVAEILHDRLVRDPFRPLEDIDSPETRSWIRRQNFKFDRFIASARDTKDRVRAFLKAAQPAADWEGRPSRYGDSYFVWRQAVGDNRYSYFVKTSETPSGKARLLLDARKIDPSGQTEISHAFPSHEGTIVAYGLSRSGSDKTEWRFKDVKTGRDMDLSYSDLYSGITWEKGGSGFGYRRLKADGSKSIEVMYHRMGTDPANDRILYSPTTPETRASIFRIEKDSTDEYGDYDWLSLATTEAGKHSLAIRPRGSDEPFREIFPHQEGTLHPFMQMGEWIYAMTSYQSPREKIIRFKVDKPEPAHWETIVPENADDPLNNAFIWHDRIFATYRHDTGDAIRVFDLQGRYLYDVPLPPLSTFIGSRFSAEDRSFLFGLENFQESGNVYRYDFDKNSLSLWKKSDQRIDLNDCIVERLYATSKDGTRIPMSVIRHPETALDASAAVLMKGYGGFKESLEPSFNPTTANWVREGGIYVQAHLRGGGEFGQDWYDQGRLKNKQNVFDDFIACAEHLVEKKYTSPRRLAIQGRSNGGLLTLATMIQRPDLFGAVVSEVPVTDMSRFHVGSDYGFAWKSDYGDPSIKDDFNAAAQYSPLHNIPKGFVHPPVLIQTAVDDERVPPWHAYKMTATLQAKEAPQSQTVLRIDWEGGHSGGDWQKRISETHAFLARTLGPINQDQFKKTRTAMDQALENLRRSVLEIGEVLDYPFKRIIEAERTFLAKIERTIRDYRAVLKP